ncbi:MAG: hypothetical protein V3T17_08190 [Pseudomonadales bacterium]
MLKGIHITGIEMIASRGTGLKKSWEGIKAGKSGVEKITPFNTEGLQSHIAACVNLADIENGAVRALHMAKYMCLFKN